MIPRTSTRRGARAALAAACAAALTAGTAVLATPAVAASAEARFIITVADRYDSRAVAAEHRRKGADVDYIYTHALNGFAGSMSEAELGELQRDRRVTRIERDGVARTAEAVASPQTGATWGLDRIDQTGAVLNGTYTFAQTGSGVHAYIIDTGIRRTHRDFGGRVPAPSATTFYDAFGGTGADCNGHGTHVAGTVGGGSYGVAKAVTLYPVRVLDCGGSGTWSGVIAGIDWVAANHVKPAVANMSLGGGASASVDDAVKRAIARGVTVVVAAGNGNQGGKEQDACGYSPARVPDAVTVGATTKTDAKTSWSNYGACVDLFAPGAGITSAWYEHDEQTAEISGTSMAAPHVAGVAALYLQSNPSAAALTVRDAIYAAATKGIVTSSKTANSHLLHSGTVVPLNAPPTASFTSSCTDLDCTFDGSRSADAEGPVAYSWDFGDGSPADTATVATYTYGTAGSYIVSLTVTDSAGVKSSNSQTITLGTTATPAITLTHEQRTVKNGNFVDLKWSGASSVDVFRNDTRIASVTGTSYTDKLRSGGTYRYKVCSSGTVTCSNEVSVTF